MEVLPGSSTLRLVKWAFSSFTENNIIMAASIRLDRIVASYPEGASGPEDPGWPAEPALLRLIARLKIGITGAEPGE